MFNRQLKELMGQSNILTEVETLIEQAFELGKAEGYEDGIADGSKDNQ